MNPDGDARKKEVEKSCSCGCSHEAHGAAERSWPFSRRGFLQGVGCGAVGVALGGLSAAAAAAEDDLAPPAAKPLRVKPILAYEIQPHQPHNSYRDYGGVDTMDKVNEEVKRIEAELKRLAEQSDFAVEFLPVAAVDTDAKAQEAAATDCDVLLVYPSGGSTIYKIAESKTPTVLFIRHKSGPYYLWHEIAHWRLLRNNDDHFRAAGDHARRRRRGQVRRGAMASARALRAEERQGHEDAGHRRIGGLLQARPGNRTAARQGGLGLPVRDHLGRGLHQAAGRRPGERESRRGGPAADQGPLGRSRT